MRDEEKHLEWDKDGYPTDPRHPWNTDKRTPEEHKELFIRRELESAHVAYSAGNIGALNDALDLCQKYDIPLPLWALTACKQLLFEKIKGGVKGQRGQKKWITRYLNDMRDYVRYQAVLEAREHGIPWIIVYEEASEILESTFGEGSNHTMEAAYKRVKKRLKVNPTRYKVLSGIRLPK